MQRMAQCHNVRYLLSDLELIYLEEYHLLSHSTTSCHIAGSLGGFPSDY